jgi:hypothetical protein
MCDMRAPNSELRRRGTTARLSSNLVSGLAYSRGHPAVRNLAGRVSLWRFCAYFLRLGAAGFGGSRQDYLDGLALAQLAPGPLAAQLIHVPRPSRVALTGHSAILQLQQTHPHA